MDTSIDSTFRPWRGAAFARLAAALAWAVIVPVSARVIVVGPAADAPTIAAAARLARNGDVVEIPAGEYVDDVAVWPQSDLRVRARGGRARLVSRGASAEAKAIFVVKGDRVTIEGLEFAGAHVADRNGAGIRHEGGRLTVRDCLFEDNEMGLLTSNDPAAELVIERSEFRGNRVADRHQVGERIGHQIYVGTIARFTLRESYVHQGAFGHLVKSRARTSLVEANRLTDEAGGRASYELEFPNGGVAYVLGNLIEQSGSTQNDDIVSFGAEGYRWPERALYLVHNTFVDHARSHGRVLHVYEGAERVDVLDNVVFGNRLQRPAAAGRFADNYTALASDAAAPERYDYRLRRRSKLVGRAHDPGTAGDVPLRPALEYVHPRDGRSTAQARAYSPGAFQALGP